MTIKHLVRVKSWEGYNGVCEEYLPEALSNQDKYLRTFIKDLNRATHKINGVFKKS